MLGVDAQQVLAEFDAALAVCGGADLPRPALQLANVRRRGGAKAFFGWPVGGEEVARPVVPHAHLPAGRHRRPPPRLHRQQNVRHAVRMPQRHLHRPGLGTGRLQAVVDDLQAQIDADVAPIVAH